MFYKVSFINIHTTRVLFIQFVSDQASSAVGEGSDELLTGLHEGLGPGSEVRLVWIIWGFFCSSTCCCHNMRRVLVMCGNDVGLCRFLASS